MTKRLSISLTLEEGSGKKKYLSAFVEETDGVQIHAHLSIERGELKHTLDALASTLKARLL